ncbi:MAG: AAA family ATPase [Paludibacteraceae bacterium]|nr:AAA family ATPase [Paludibacteraceae bacterium]
MGLYLNPNADAFMEDKGTRIYVDKSLLIRELNSIVSTKEDFVCLSRPRRFGKSMAGNMISAYYCLFVAEKLWINVFLRSMQKPAKSLSSS